MANKKIIVYYSFDGNTKFVAENIARIINADLLELKPVRDEIPRNFMKYFWGGRQVFMKRKPILLPLTLDPQDYDAVFIATPVWAFNYTPPIASFFEAVKLEKKRIGLICCSGGMKGKTFENMKEKLSGNEIIGELHLKEPLRSKEKSLEKIESWLKAIEI